jgi:hypothetical protein
LNINAHRGKEIQGKCHVKVEEKLEPMNPKGCCKNIRSYKGTGRDFSSL